MATTNSASTVSSYWTGDSERSTVRYDDTVNGWLAPEQSCCLDTSHAITIS